MSFFMKAFVFILFWVLSTTVFAANIPQKAINFSEYNFAPIPFTLDYPEMGPTFVKQSNEKVLKISIHVNKFRTLDRAGSPSDTVTLHCNGSIAKIKADETIICLRSANSSGYFEIDSSDYKNGADGVIKEIK